MTGAGPASQPGGVLAVAAVPIGQAADASPRLTAALRDAAVIAA